MNDRRKRRLTNDETELWRRAVRDAAPLPDRQPSIKRPMPKRAPPRPHVSEDGAYDAPPELPGGRRQNPLANRQALPTANRLIDRATYARLKKGRLPIEGRIDLHGMTAATAQRNLTGFLRQCQAVGMKAVLVITGRGLDPEGLGRGVLKRETPHWLDALPDVVAGYGEADRKHGGAGALYVRLRRKDKVNRR